MYTFFSVLLFSFFITAIFLYYFRLIAYKFEIIDTPDGRLKRQERPVAYLGGLGVLCGLFSSFLIFCGDCQIPLLFFLCICLLALLGVFDDVLRLHAFAKFLLQGVISYIFIKSYAEKITFYGYSIPDGISDLLLFFWSMLVINACNLIDVMDGLLATTTLAISCSYIALIFLCCQQQILPLLLLVTLLGALLAFLCYNWPPATMYFGDSGSLFLGGFFAWMPFLINWPNQTGFILFIPALLLAIPLLEVTALIIIRHYKSIPFYQGSPHHFSHYLLQKGWRKSTILIFTGLFTLTWAGLAYLFFFMPFYLVVSCSLIIISFWGYIVYCCS